MVQVRKEFFFFFLLHLTRCTKTYPSQGTESQPEAHLLQPAWAGHLHPQFTAPYFPVLVKIEPSSSHCPALSPHPSPNRPRQKMDLDPEIARWILEFVLVQPNVDDFLANSLVLALPVTQPLEPRLKKTILLRRIISELSRDSVSARTLHSLELLDEIDRNGGVAPSESMRAAYFAVAVECTARSLLKSDEHFFKTVDQIWSRRVADLERSEAAGLACSRLKKFRKEMVEAALPNPAIRADLLEKGTEKRTLHSVIRTELLERDTEKVALNCVRAYLEEAINMMGPPLLEFTAKAVLSGRLVLKEQSREPSVRTGKKEKCLKDVSISIVKKSVDELGHSQIDGGTSSRSHVISELPCNFC